MTHDELLKQTDEGLFCRTAKDGKKEACAYYKGDILSLNEYMTDYYFEGDDRYYREMEDNEDEADYVWMSELPVQPKYAFELELPDNPRTGDYCGTPLLFEVKIPSVVESISPFTFNYSGLCEIDVPSHVKKIEGPNFRECENLCRVITSEGFEVIEDDCFCKCPNLKYVVLPDSIKSIDKEAFLETNPVFFVPAGCKERYAEMLPAGSDIREGNVPAELVKEVEDLMYKLKVSSIVSVLEKLTANWGGDQIRAALVYNRALKYFPDEPAIMEAGKKVEK